MRLLHTRTLQVHEFQTDIPPYAILSHTWEQDEVSFQDILHLQIAKRKAGFRKVKKACVHARKYNFDWIWIDSCCIDKDSSAELSEAINSMYQYYQDAEVCYAYLYDVSSREDPRDTKSTFKGCRWFRRGWTLQELLAPSHVVFLDKDWVEIGTKWNLRDAISAITSIPSRALEDGDIERFSIAQRMSWAALRETTRPEDQAYCLMGMFGVSMPPIYGEGGPKAFVRLQQEIIKISDDRSIFAWIASPGETEPRGLLARTPFEFRMSGEVGISESDTIGNKSSYSFTNNGLHIHLPLVPAPLLVQNDQDQEENENGPYLASLHCRSEKDGNYLSVYLQKTSGERYFRCRADELALVPETPPPSFMDEIVVREYRILRQIVSKSAVKDNPSFHFRLLPSARDHFTFDRPIISTNPFSPNPMSPSSFSPTSFDEETHKCRIMSDSDMVALKFRAHVSEEEFSVLSWTKNGALFSKLTDAALNYPSDLMLFERECNPRSDRILIYLHSGLVSLTIQMTGDRSVRVLEVGYINKESPTMASLTRILQPPRMGFMAPFTAILGPSGFRSSLSTYQFSLQQVFPPDFFHKTCGEQIYLSMDIDDPYSTFRVLTYRLDTDIFASWTFHLVLGFRGLTPWTDIILDWRQSKTAEEIWKDYLDFGAQNRLRCQADATVIYELGVANHVRYRIKVSTEKRKTLQFGTHLAKFDCVLLKS